MAVSSWPADSAVKDCRLSPSGNPLDLGVRRAEMLAICVEFIDGRRDIRPLLRVSLGVNVFLGRGITASRPRRVILITSGSSPVRLKGTCNVPCAFGPSTVTDHEFCVGNRLPLTSGKRIPKIWKSFTVSSTLRR